MYDVHCSDPNTVPNDGATAPPADLMPVVPGYESFGPNGEKSFGSYS